MLAEAILLASAFEILPFYQQKPDYAALRPLWSEEGSTTDVLWPVFTSHRDWWRFCYLVYDQDHADGGHQFTVFPVWWHGNGTVRKEGEKTSPRSSYWGLFPIWGGHPHVLMMHDWRFCLWPLWMRYETPRPKENRSMVSNSVLFPFFHWRDDGSWGFWPVYGVSHNRADDHWYALWPVWNMKSSFADRDTGGEGTSWMLWPLLGRVDREREKQWMFLPPFFSHAQTPDGWRGRYPLPLVEIERMKKRDRTSVFPFYEHIENRAYGGGAPTGEITRFGWRLVELLPDETRVFPFWVSRSDDAYFRLWPFWESKKAESGETYSRCLSLFPIRWVDAVDRNWSKFWTFYERVSDPVGAEHSLFWGLVKWRTRR